MRLVRATSSSAGSALDALFGDAVGAESARARRWASIYDVRSSPAGARAGAGAIAAGTAGVGGGISGAGRLSAMTGGGGGRGGGRGRGGARLGGARPGGGGGA